MSRKRIRAAIVAVAAVVAVAGVTGAALARPAAKQAGVTLTLWHNYGTEGNAVATKSLVAAFEKANPSITIKVVSQPADNYFALLQAASISKTGPDLAVMWTGLFDIKYQKFLLNLKPYFSAAEIAKINGAKWMAPDFNTANGLLVMPLETQFYIGFYNKALFAKAGLSGPPTNWNQLYADCSALKAKGITPMVYGSDTQGLGATFYPFYDFSYQMSGILSPAQWKGLYTGKTSWTSPAIVSQMSKWAALKTKGCTNPDVLTKSNILGAFSQGKAAMIVDGNWDTATLQKGLGKNLVPFAPPFSSGKQKGVVQYPGDGFSITSYSKHPKEAAAFLKFMMTPAAAKLISNAGLIPAIKGYSTPNTVSNQMLALAAKQGFTAYPMLDNVIQPEVVDVASKELVAAFGGDTSVTTALGDMKSKLDSLPSDRKGPSYK
ncbi:MAG: raffinose/stachyose/melibiose transport system substrate-binding protein [Gaiellales bacterium]|jgi:raffinose/stachyose/melibiose transport system substrate-binding protein|nr:raffinose/stachyose/melibiose transport system substrate-binding protein [Gaiellales bacterium]